MQINARLTTDNSEHDKIKSVTIVELSKLTATNNNGAFMFAMNESKARMLLDIEMDSGGNKNTDSQNANKTFALSVPVHGMECMLHKLVADDSYLDADDVPWATIGTKDTNEQYMKGITGCVTHLRCRVYDSLPQRSSENGKTCIVLLAQVEEAFVHSNYWDNTKGRFVPEDACQPFLKRLGRDTLGYVLSISTNSLS
jgi:hypothetical protein